MIGPPQGASTILEPPTVRLKAPKKDRRTNRTQEDMAMGLGEGGGGRKTTDRGSTPRERVRWCLLHAVEVRGGV